MDEPTGSELRPRFNAWPASLLAAVGATPADPPSSTFLLPNGGYLFTVGSTHRVVRERNSAVHRAISAQLRRDQAPADRIILAEEYLVVVFHNREFHKCMLVDRQVPAIKLYNSGEDHRDAVALLLYSIGLHPQQIEGMFEAAGMIIRDGRPAIREHDEFTEKWSLVRLELPESIVHRESERVTWVARPQLPHDWEKVEPRDRLIARFSDVEASLLAAAQSARFRF